MSIVSVHTERRDRNRPPAVFTAMQAGLRAYVNWRACRADRATLRALSSRTLADIGIDRSEITSVVYGRGRDRSRRRRGPWRWIRFI